MKRFLLVFTLFIFSSVSFAQIRSIDISQSTGNNWQWRGKSKVGTGTPSISQTEGSLYINGILESANAVYLPGITPNGTLLWINSAGQVKGVVLGSGVAFDTMTGTLTATGTGISGTLTSTRIPYATGASTLTDTANLFWNNGSNILNVVGSVILGDGTGAPAFLVNGAAGQSRLVTFQTNGLSRWKFGSNGTAEGGSDAGSNFELDFYNDAGSLLGLAMFGIRATGAIQFRGLAGSAGPSASGSSSLIRLGPNDLSGGSSNGTYLGINPGTFTGDFENYMVSNASKWKVTSAGALTAASTINAAAITSSAVVTGTGLKATGLTSQAYIGTDSSGNLQAATTPVSVHSVTKVIGIAGSTDTDYVIGGSGCAEIGACIVTAVAALPAVGGSIIIREGAYTQTSAAIINKSNVTLEGAGKSVTITRGWAGTTVNDGSMIVVGDAVSAYTGIKIRNLRFDGVKATYANVWNSAITLRGASNVVNESDCIIEYCTFTNHNGITINGVSNLTTTLINRNIITGGGSFGIYTNIGNGNTISYNSVSTCTTAGIKMEGTPTSLNSSILIGNTSSSNTGQGFLINAQTGTSITNNYAYSNTLYGFNLSSNGLKITGNHLESNGTAGGAGSGGGININDTCVDCTISGNEIKSNTGEGIYILSTAGISDWRMSVVGNTISLNTTYGFYASTSGTLISNCVISNNTFSGNTGSGAQDSMLIYGGNNIISNNNIIDTAGTGVAINIIASGSNNILSNNNFSGTGAASITDSSSSTKWNHQWDGTRYIDRTVGLQIYQNGPFFTATADATIANTVSETSLIGTGIGTKTLPANFLVIGKTIRVKTRGYLSDTLTPTLNFKFKLGSTQIVATSAITLGVGISNVGYEAEFELTCRTTGASGTVYGQGRVIVNGVAVNATATATATIDTTATQVVDISGTWGTASASNTITTSNAVLEALN